MGRHILDFNPATGETVYFDYHESGDGTQAVITHAQDVTPIVERAHAWAVKTEKTDYGIKNDLWHYARVPNSIILEMKTKHGVDFFDRNDRPKVFQLLEGEYSAFKTTHKSHLIKHD